MTLRVHYLQNLATAGVGNIADWAGRQGHILAGTALDAGESLPALSTFDLLIVLGGVPGECRSWINDEIAFIRRAIDAGKGVLGICLGSQLIAEALGGKLIPHLHAESGWWPVTLRTEAQDEPLLEGVAEETRLFFFHRNTFTLPEGARWLATSPGCAHQMMAYGDRVLAIQAHPEMQAEGVAYLACEKVDQLPAGPFHALCPADSSASADLANAERTLHRILDNLSRALA
ncbi:type 1 glutamine amidotransferase [Salinicola rhizosphaerae]|uniref:Amidotransferase n=1 Tax=Salinicola rhizosphaerae TaxID=1443141 RepID=A0ABQ3DZL3_9GAMM|nr:type 1 glutamine amidotransferase [Salinicola rhizosphaerae]GHB21533.1 amidotransferase [Salinicola rhizosphaerae]